MYRILTWPSICLTLEAPDKHEKQRFLDIVSKILPLLYLKGSLLPKIPEPDKEANERFLTLEEYEIQFNKLRDVFGKDDVHYMIDMHGDKDFPVKVSASELLSDIYQDMKDFVLLYQKNSRASKQNAAYNGRLNFLKNWGNKSR